MVTPEAVCRAINARQIVTFVYHTHNRRAIPLVVYPGEKNGWVLHSRQIGGTSSSRKPPCWLDASLDEIEDFADTGDSFSDSHIPDDYEPEASKFTGALCKVPKPS